MECFWEIKFFDEMIWFEWELICDGCVKCCLYKFIDDDVVNEVMIIVYVQVGEVIYFINIVCDLLNIKICSCIQYVKCIELVLDCV